MHTTYISTGKSVYFRRINRFMFPSLIPINTAQVLLYKSHSQKSRARVINYSPFSPATSFSAASTALWHRAASAASTVSAAPSTASFMRRSAFWAVSCCSVARAAASAAVPRDRERRAAAMRELLLRSSVRGEGGGAMVWWCGARLLRQDI